MLMGNIEGELKELSGMFCISNLSLEVWFYYLSRDSLEPAGGVFIVLKIINVISQIFHDISEDLRLHMLEL